MMGIVYKYDPNHYPLGNPCCQINEFDTSFPEKVAFPAYVYLKLFFRPNSGQKTSIHLKIRYTFSAGTVTADTGLLC